MFPARPDLMRARSPRGRRATGAVVARDAAQAAHVVAAIRAGDRVAAARPITSADSLTPSGSLAALREAAETRRPVLIGYVDNHGTRSERIVEPSVGIEFGCGASAHPKFT